MIKFINSCFTVTFITAAFLASSVGTTCQFPAKAASITYGDVNADKIVDSADYTLMRKYLLGKIVDFPSSDGMSAADVFYDEVINSADYMILRSFLIGKITSLPVNLTVTPTKVATLTPTPAISQTVTITPTPVATQAGDLFVSPDGLDTNQGTKEKPTSLTAAINKIASGNTIFLLGGTYKLSNEITIIPTNSGSEGKTKNLFAYGNEKPVIDFSSIPYISNEVNPKGIKLGGSYWHFKNLVITGAADNGLYLCGHHNTIELCEFHHNRDSGVQISRYDDDVPNTQWPSNNLILNCDSYENDDPDNHEDADGFACKLTAGEGNVFRGCIAYHNNDDGWDLFTKPATGPIGKVLIENCIAYENGYLGASTGLAASPGDGNGFKLGGSQMPVDHTIRNSIAFKNRVKGIHYNSNSGSITVENCTSWDNKNGGNFVFTRGTHIFKNNLSFFNVSKSDEPTGTDVEGTNCWWSSSKGSYNAKGLNVDQSDFINLNPTISRGSNGDLILGDFLKLAPGSDLIGAGVDGKNIGAR